MTKSAIYTNYILLAIGVLLTAIYLFPLYWMYVTSLKSQSEIFATPPAFWPGEAHWENFVRVWTTRAMGRYMLNSLIIAIGVTALTAVVGTGAAYVLARFRTRWIEWSLFMVLVLQVLPQSLMVTPFFVGFSQIGLLDTPRLAVVIALSARTIPFFIILARATFMSVPKELEEAALVDGNSRIGALVFIVLPLARNGILVVSLLIFLQAFGEFVYSKSLIQKNVLQTATVGLNAFMGPNTNDWTGVMAYSTIYVTPILIIFMLMQRHIVSGLTHGALK